MPDIICPSQQPAYHFCVDTECSKPGLMCINADCTCREAHLHCNTHQVKSVKNNLNKAKVQIAPEIKETLQFLASTTEDMIDRLKSFLDDIFKIKMNIGLGEWEGKLYSLIMGKKFD